jgi:type I restriction enzyme S subunit
MSEWKTYKLGELGTLARGKSKHRPRDAAFLYGGEYPFIQTGDIKAANHKINKHTQTYSEEGLRQSKLWPAGTICITIAANIADTAILSYPACFPDSVIGFVADENKCNVDFIEYLLQYTKRSIQSHSIGSVQDNINLGTFENFTMEVPDLPTQKQIASILSSLDDKIELNLQMNQTLEAMAQAIFKEWFVNFNFPGFDGELVDGLPKGWTEVSMKDFGKIICGKTPSKAVDEYFGGEYMFLKIPDMHNSVFVIETSDTLTNEGLQSQPNKTLPPYSICVSSIATVGLVCMNPFPCQTNQQINSIVPSEPFLKYYLFFLSKSMKDTFVATASGGTATLNMNTSQFSILKAVRPNDDVLLEFDEIVSPMMERILANEYEIKSLTQIRDSLLPKLMTGKIEIQA